VRKTAKATGVQPLRDAIMTILCLRLEEILRPSKSQKPKLVRVKKEPKPPRSITRIPEIEQNIALGVELLALRATTPSKTWFGQRARAQFNVDQLHASKAMRVARLYADRPEIYRAASWVTLVELSSPKMSQSVRQAIEAKILAGQAVSAPLGRMGGKARAAGMTAKKRSEIAKKAAKSRWKS
jgi:hypothetical protein